MKAIFGRTTRQLTAATMVLIGIAAGCQQEEKAAEEDAALKDEARRISDAEMVWSVREEQVDNGVIAEHTLYPHHFVTGTSTLNALGERDLGILAEHYRRNAPADGAAGGTVEPWMLNVRRGDASDALYSARVRSVTAGLTRGGLAANSVRVVDETAGGSGSPSERVRIVLERELTAKQYYEEKNSSSAAGTAIDKTSGGSK